MRNFLLGLSLSLLLVQAGFGACADTTVILKAGTPGFTAGTGFYDPDAAGAVNSIISGCTEAAITVHINLDATLAKTLKDTVVLTSSIKVTGRSNKTTKITSLKDTATIGVADTIITFVENTLGFPALFTAASTNRVEVSGFGFARKTVGSSIHSVTLAGQGSTISDCHFWMLDKDGVATGALLEIQADSILVERCLFRAPVDGVGRSIAVHTGAAAARVEIRSNVFYSTGLYLTVGSCHIYANTFAGSRNAYNCIIIGAGVVSPETNIGIQHNLFVPKFDTLPPIFFSGNTTSENVQKNAWSRSIPSMALAVNASLAAVTLNNATGSNVNTPLPRGFSNYRNTLVSLKDYPLTQLRTDPTLAANHPEFGKIFQVFASTPWSAMSDIKDGLPAGKLYFPNGFSPFSKNKTWFAGIKVGAFPVLDQVETPSPLDSGSQGSSLKFVKDSTNAANVKLLSATYNTAYYKSNIVPAFTYYFFDTTLSHLTASNDSIALKIATSQSFIRRPFPSAPTKADSLFTVPTGMRSGRDIYIKMLHYRQSWQAPVLSNAVIATVTGVPSFPLNDLTLTLTVGPPTDLANGVVRLTVARKTEAIDSILVVAAKEDGTIQATLAKLVGGTNTSTTFDFTLPKGAYYFYAVPVVKLTSPVGASKLGQPTKNSNTVNLRPAASDTVYVRFKTDTLGCGGFDGKPSTPYCGLDSALKDIQNNNGGVIVITNGTTPVAMQDVSIAPFSVSDTSAVSIITTTNTSYATLKKFEENRPVFRGNLKEALTITRKNVTLRGFVIEMPANSTNRAAISVKAGGVLIDANIFRVQSKVAGAEGPAVNIDVGNFDMRMTNNVVWGFTKAVTVTNSPSAGIRIINNTFLDDPLISNSGTTVGVSAVGSSMSAIIANNFFSNIALPIAASVAGKTPTLDHNVFTTDNPNLQGLIDAGDLDSNDAARSVDLTAPTYILDLNDALNEAFNSSAIHPGPSLQAASSTADYKTNLITDVFGKVRPAKKDVGAFEINPEPSTVRGRLAVKTTAVENVFSKVNFEISTKNFDPLESDSIYVWWTTSASGSLDATPAGAQKHYPMSKLDPGSFSDVATGLAEKTLYNIRAAYGRTTAGVRKLGFIYSDTITTLFNLEVGDCSFAVSDTVCPSKEGVFVSVGGSFDKKFQTRINFSEKVDAGSAVKNPVFSTIDNFDTLNLNLSSPLPKITLVINVASLGAAGSSQSFKASIEMDVQPDLTGKELFLLPDDPTALPANVSTWQLIKENGKSKLIIEGTKGGTLHYAFGTLAVAAEPGKVQMADVTMPVFDYQTAGDSISQIAFNIKGTGFKTSNPLILVSSVPAGGTSVGVLSGKYPVGTVALSKDLAGLSPELRKDRFYKYFLKAAGAEALASNPSGLKKPFALDSVTAGALDSSLVYKNLDLAIAGTGELAPTSISIPMGKGYKDADLGRKASRSIEVVFTIFDGSKLTRTRGFIRTHFQDENLQILDKKQFNPNKWNLYGYPWDEADTGSQARIVGGKKWDASAMRLMKYKGSGKGAGSFQFFDGSKASGVKFDSGQAVWSGSTHFYDPDCGSGISLDYQTFEMTMPAGQYSDISLPFNFPMKMKDILDSSGIAMPSMFRFNADNKTWEALKDTSVLQPWDGITLKPLAPVTFKFPVMDATRSSAVATLKPAAGTENQWTAKVRAFNGTASMSLQIGKASREGRYAEPPDVPGQDFRMVLKRLRPDGEVEALSEYVQSEAGTWQGHWPLQTTASKGSQGVFLSVSNNSKDIPIYLVETLHKTVTQLSGDSVHISEADLKANDYHLVAGDASYLDAVLAGLSPAHMLTLSNYPNPFSGSTLIRYVLPNSFGKVDFLLKVRDFRGRTVFEKNLLGAGSLNFIWDGKDNFRSPLPAGVYTLVLEAKVVGKTPYRATRRLLKL